MELSLAVRRQVTARLVGRYQKASRAEKSAIVDQLCQVNGCIAIMRAGRCAGRRPGRRGRVNLGCRWSGSARKSLRRCGCVGRCSTNPRACGWRRRCRGWWVRCGLMASWSSMMGPPVCCVRCRRPPSTDQFCYTLCVTAVATGWTCARSVRTKGERVGERVVAAALQAIAVELPFALVGFHSDNGSQFINHHLLRWADALQITFTRARPHHSNDNTHVEQKNYSIVRRAAGSFRYDTPREL